MFIAKLFSMFQISSSKSSASCSHKLLSTGHNISSWQTTRITVKQKQLILCPISSHNSAKKSAFQWTSLCVFYSSDHCIHHFTQFFRSQWFMMCAHSEASGADRLIKARSPSSFPAITRAASTHRVWPLHEIITNFDGFFCCCSSLYRFAGNHVFINCCIFNISCAGYQVTSTATVSRVVTLYWKRFFQTSESAVLLSSDTSTDRVIWERYIMKQMSTFFTGNFLYHVCRAESIPFSAIFFCTILYVTW